MAFHVYCFVLFFNQELKKKTGASQKRLLKANSKLKVAQNILHRRNVN